MMASNAIYDDSYGEMHHPSEDTSVSFHGVVGQKWTPRKISAIRDFPKAFEQVPMCTDLSDVWPPFSVKAPKNVSGMEDTTDDSKNVLESHKLESNKVKPQDVLEESVLCCIQLPKALNSIRSENTEVYSLSKQQKVPLIHDSPKGVAGDSIDNAGPEETDSDAKESSLKAGLRNLEYELSESDSEDELVTFETGTVSEENSIISTEILDLGHDIEESSDHEDTEVAESIIADEVKCYSERRISAVRCFPPGCGENAMPLSEEELEKAFAESKNHYLTCKTCGYDEDEKETYEDDGIRNDEKETVEVNDKRHLVVVLALYAESRCPWRNKTVPKLDENNASTSIADLENSTKTETSEVDYGTPKSCRNGEIEEDCNINEELHYHRKRVSAIRCFPPGCGSDAVPLSEKDLKEAIAESQKHHSTCKSCGAEENEFEDVWISSNKKPRTEDKSDGHCRVVVRALAAAQNCPWRNSRKQNTSSS